MKKNMSLEVKANQVDNTGAKNISRLPYTSPQLLVYNQAKITMGGLNLTTQDWINPGTSYRAS